MYPKPARVDLTLGTWEPAAKETPGEGNEPLCSRQDEGAHQRNSDTAREVRAGGGVRGALPAAAACFLEGPLRVPDTNPNIPSYFVKPQKRRPREIGARQR